MDILNSYLTPAVLMLIIIGALVYYGTHIK
jgi:hypothetical protein